MHFQHSDPTEEKRLRDILRHQDTNRGFLVAFEGPDSSGKTTQLPKICLELGRGVAGIIGHTQPRRIAATSAPRTAAWVRDTDTQRRTSTESATASASTLHRSHTHTAVCMDSVASGLKTRSANGGYVKYRWSANVLV